VIQAYIIIGTLVLIGFIGGLVVGRATAPKKQVTVTETVEVPSYEANSLPVAEEVTYFDVPLSHSLQRYIYEVCADENVPVSLIIAMIDQESKFNPEVVSKTGDYGAKKAWENGIKSTSYSESVLALMQKYEQEVNVNATNADAK
jgi:hypothetical protein